MKPLEGDKPCAPMFRKKQDHSRCVLEVCWSEKNASKCQSVFDSSCLLITHKNRMKSNIWTVNLCLNVGAEIIKFVLQVCGFFYLYYSAHEEVFTT